MVLVLFFAIAQSAAPLMHAHFAGGGARDSGVHIHLGTSLPPASGDHGIANEIRDFEARILSAPDEYFKDEALRVLDLPAIGANASNRHAQPMAPLARYVCVPTTAPQLFPKPLPLAPPVSA